ncbi:hypothetical protein NAL19_392 [Pectobacterium sp. F1-1]|nr:hypothetical protein NAL19_392 [Pectobacterium sp. F1-1]
MNLVIPRFIPAGAGNTEGARLPLAFLSVYPRWRGEHQYLTARYAICCGLSPLARGTQSCLPLIQVVARFIPAGAGNTERFDLSSGKNPVYPRWRGEHVSENQEAVTHFGLSPLARGTREARKTTEAGYPVYPRWRGEHAE